MTLFLTSVLYTIVDRCSCESLLAARVSSTNVITNYLLSTKFIQLPLQLVFNFSVSEGFKIVIVCKLFYALSISICHVLVRPLSWLQEPTE